MLPAIFSGNAMKVIRIVFTSSKVMASAKFALFAALLNSVYKFVLCLTRRIVKKFLSPSSSLDEEKMRIDKICAPIAGFCTGLALILDTNNSRKTLFTCTAMSRIIDSGLSKAEKDEIIPTLPHRGLVMFVVGNLIT
jgi:hypothetical protein